MENYLKNIWEELTGKRNPFTGKKIEEKAKAKKFNGWIFGLLLLCGFIPGVIYLIWYAHGR
jgi:hypothetical protein